MTTPHLRSAFVLGLAMPEEPQPWWTLFDSQQAELDEIAFVLHGLYLMPKPAYISVNRPAPAPVPEKPILIRSDRTRSRSRVRTSFSFHPLLFLSLHVVSVSQIGIGTAVVQRRLGRGIGGGIGNQPERGMIERPERPGRGGSGMKEEVRAEIEDEIGAERGRGEEKTPEIATGIWIGIAPEIVIKTGLVPLSETRGRGIGSAPIAHVMALGPTAAPHIEPEMSPTPDLTEPIELL